MTTPDTGNKPQTLPSIKKPTWKYIFKQTAHEFKRDDCTDLAAALTYHAVLSLFPALLALVALLGIIGQAETTTNAILDVVQNVAPAQVTDLLREPIKEVVHSPAAGFALILGIAVALWSASGYVRSFSRAMNRIYEIEEGRPFWKLLPTMLLITLAMLVLVAIMAVILALTGPILKAIGDVVGLGAATIAVWKVAKWPVLVLIAIVMIALLYYFTPNVKLPRFRWISLGAVTALVIMAIASLGFAFYVANFSNYNKTYGAIGGVIVVLLWIWIMNLALLAGAEFDSETERGRELQAGLPAAESLHLPRRDTRGTRKKQAKEQNLIAVGRELREQANDDPDERRPAPAEAEAPERAEKKKKK